MLLWKFLSTLPFCISDLRIVGSDSILTSEEVPGTTHLQIPSDDYALLPKASTVGEQTWRAFSAPTSQPSETSYSCPVTMSSAKVENNTKALEWTKGNQFQQ